MKISQKLIFGFMSIVILVGLIGTIYIVLNREIGTDIAQLVESAIYEVEGAAEMSFALQASQIHAQELIAEKYRLLLEPDEAVDAVNQAEMNIHEALKSFEKWLRFTQKATQWGVRKAESTGEQEEADREREEIEALNRLEFTFIGYKKALLRYVEITQTNLSDANENLEYILEPLYKQIISQIRLFQEGAEAELILEINQIKQGLSTTTRLMIGATIFVFIVAIGLGLYFSNLISTPLVKLRNAAVMIGEGHLNTTVEIHSKDEIGELGASFNKMAKDLINANTSITSSKEYLDKILQSITDFLIVIDSNGTILTINKATLNILGYEEQDLVGKLFMQIMPDNELGLLQEKGTETDIREGSIKGIESTLMTKDGRKVPVLFSSSIMDYQEDRKMRIVCVAKDITDFRRLEEQLRQNQKMESLGTLVGGIAHDFNTLIGTISGYTDIIAKDVPKDSITQDDLKAMAAVILQAKNLVKQIKEFSRPKGITKEPKNMIDIVNDSLELIKKLLPSTISIQTEIEMDQLIVLVNEDQIKQVLINLFSNAADFMSGSNQKLKLRIDEVIIKEEIKYFHNARPEKQMKLTLSDNGCGIDPEFIDRIFDPYFTTREFGKGNGLGLSVVHGIIKGHDGNIFVESKVNEGTTFIIFLPLVSNQ